MDLFVVPFLAPLGAALSAFSEEMTNDGFNGTENEDNICDFMKAFLLKSIGKGHFREVLQSHFPRSCETSRLLQFESSKNSSVYMSCCAWHIVWKIQKAAGNMVFATHFIFALGSKLLWQSNFEISETTQKIHTHLLVCLKNLSTAKI